MFRCTNCHKTFSKWTGKCLNCGTWNTLEEFTVEERKEKFSGKGRVQIGEKIKLNSSEKQYKIKSSSGELDSVLGGGMTPGSMILLSGEPGIGKSTLALQMAHWYSVRSVRVLYISGEENIAQISKRANRLGVHAETLEVITTNCFEDIIATIEEGNSDIIIIDSISVLSSNVLEGALGSIAQIRTMTEIFMSLAKRLEKSILLIGHITKDGSISGPKSLEHLVDVVLFLEGSRTESYRILRSFKNRFGSTDIVGLFRMTEGGLIDLPNPGFEFVDRDNVSLIGSALSLTIEGNRPLLIEIEALTAYTKFGYPKRSGRGIPMGKLDLLIAVIGKFTETKLENYDIYANIARGVQVHEPGIDIALVAAIVSSRLHITLGHMIWLGEVSLTGVVKHIFMLERRIAEAVKLGFTRIIVPAGYEGKIPPGIEVIMIRHITELEKMIKGRRE